MFCLDMGKAGSMRIVASRCLTISSTLFLIAASFIGILSGPASSSSAQALSIYIRATGAVEPSNAPLVHVGGGSYVLMDSVFGNLVVECSDVVIEGMGRQIYGNTGDLNSTGLGTGIDIFGVHNITLKNISLSMFGDGVVVSDTSDVVLDSLQLNGMIWQGIAIWMSRNVTVENCSLLSVNGGIVLTSSDSCAVLNCSVISSTGGISVVGGSDHNIIRGNSLVDSSAISVDGSNNVVDSNNLTAMSRNWGDGIFVKGDFNSITGNFLLSLRVGLTLDEAMNASVSMNHMGACWEAGLWLYYPSFYQLQNPTTSDLQTGNSIFKNDFVINAVQVSFDKGPIAVCTWDDGYPAGGNYWSDCRGNDTMSGPGQNVAGSDGILDAAYNVRQDNLEDSVNLDPYPLQSPVWPGDITPPRTTDDYREYYQAIRSADFTVNLTAVDDLSGVNDTYYTIDSGPVMSVGMNGQPFITVEGYLVTLSYWSVDNSSNTGTRIETLVVLDKTPPVAKLSAPSEVTVGDYFYLDSSNSSDNVGMFWFNWHTWQMGDGITMYGDDSVVQYVYSKPGVYVVNLTVMDMARHTNTTSLIVTAKAAVHETDYSVWIIAGIVGLVAITAPVLLLMRRRGTQPGS